MKKISLIALLFFPLLAFGSGWSYYVLNDEGNWELVSNRDLDLSVPRTGAESATGAQRVMILFNKPKPKSKGRKTQSWIRQVDSDLVQEVE